MATSSQVQNYPRIDDEESKYQGYLNVEELKEHHYKFSYEDLKEIIRNGIRYADEKSRRKIEFEIEGHTRVEKVAKFKKEAKALFRYFVTYSGEPAATAYQCLNKHFSSVASEAFNNRITQMQRMNSGWRYQHIAKDSARLCKRFSSVSDLNLQEADFVAQIDYKHSDHKLNIYVSVKNRSNTMGGQDWPKAIQALEIAAKGDKNRRGPYICVFGIAIDKGNRIIKRNSKSNQVYSANTEVWFSNFFWPFFSNYTYEEISKAVLDVLMELNYESGMDKHLPEQVITHFGEICSDLNLIDENGIFNNPQRLIEIFCRTK